MVCISTHVRVPRAVRRHTTRRPRHARLHRDHRPPSPHSVLSGRLQSEPSGGSGPGARYTEGSGAAVVKRQRAAFTFNMTGVACSRTCVWTEGSCASMTQRAFVSSEGPQKERRRTGVAGGRAHHTSGAPCGTSQTHVHPSADSPSGRRPPEWDNAICSPGWERTASTVEPGCNYALMTRRS